MVLSGTGFSYQAPRVPNSPLAAPFESA